MSNYFHWYLARKNKIFLVLFMLTDGSLLGSHSKSSNRLSIKAYHISFARVASCDRVHKDLISAARERVHGIFVLDSWRKRQPTVGEIKYLFVEMRKLIVPPSYLFVLLSDLSDSH